MKVHIRLVYVNRKTLPRVALMRAARGKNPSRPPRHLPPPSNAWKQRWPGRWWRLSRVGGGARSSGGGWASGEMLPAARWRGSSRWRGGAIGRPSVEASASNVAMVLGCETCAPDTGGGVSLCCGVAAKASKRRA